MRFIYLVLLFIHGALFAQAKPFTVIIDPGHGGSDHGATAGTIREADITLNISRELAQLLNSQSEIQAKLTRTTDMNLDLVQRAAIINNAGAQAMISVHANWSTDPTIRGLELYFQNQIPIHKADELVDPHEESLFLTQQTRTIETFEPQASREANIILNDLFKTGHIFLSAQVAKTIAAQWTLGPVKKKAIKQAPFYVIAEAKIPAVLVEVGYISNPTEQNTITNAQGQKRIARDLFMGLVGFKEMIDKQQYPGLN